MTLWMLLLACASDPRAAEVAAPSASSMPAPPSGAAEADLPAVERYAAARDRLATTRATLATEPRTPALRAKARAALLEGVGTGLAEPWTGTAWAFHGTSETPGEGAIACGYFVSTLLRDAGLDVERVRLAQQPAEHIVQTFAAPGSIRRFRTGDVDAVVDAVLAEPEGVYVVGFDFHVGLLVRQSEGVRFCHSSYVTAEGVVCEDPRTAVGFRSDYHVFGPVLEDAIVDAWLDGDAIPTVTE